MPSTARGPFLKSRTSFSTTMLLSRVIDSRLLTERVSPGLELRRVDLAAGEALGEDLVGSPIRRPRATPRATAPEGETEDEEHDGDPEGDPEWCDPGPRPCGMHEHGHLQFGRVSKTVRLRIISTLMISSAP